MRIRKDLRFDSDKVSIRRFDDGLLLEQIKSSAWPEGFFKDIRITDPSFERPSEGKIALAILP